MMHHPADSRYFTGNYNYNGQTMTVDRLLIAGIVHVIITLCRLCPVDTHLLIAGIRYVITTPPEKEKV